MYFCKQYTNIYLTIILYAVCTAIKTNKRVNINNLFNMQIVLLEGIHELVINPNN